MPLTQLRSCPGFRLLHKRDWSIRHATRRLHEIYKDRPIPKSRGSREKEEERCRWEKTHKGGERRRKEWETVRRVFHDFKLDFPVQEPPLVSIRRVNRRDIMSSRYILCIYIVWRAFWKSADPSLHPPPPSSHKDVISCGTQNLYDVSSPPLPLVLQRS